MAQVSSGVPIAVVSRLTGSVIMIMTVETILMNKDVVSGSLTKTRCLFRSSDLLVCYWGYWGGGDS